jgi:SMI1 / KNR4 family (SUKH-1)
MDEPSRRYQDVARFFRAYASAEGMRLVARPATLDEIEHAERELGAPFPNSYRWFQLEFGDFEDGPVDIYSPRTPEPSHRNIVGINIEERTEDGPRLPAHLIAFSDSGGGDLLCFDTTRRDADECPVVWWDHELDEDQEPAEAAPSFLDWLEGDLKERAAEERGSLLDSLPYTYKHWIDTWVKRFRE